MRTSALPTTSLPPPPDSMQTVSTGDLHDLLAVAESALGRARQAAAIGDAEAAHAALMEAQGAHDFALALRRDLATR